MGNLNYPNWIDMVLINPMWYKKKKKIQLNGIIKKKKLEDHWSILILHSI